MTSIKRKFDDCAGEHLYNNKSRNKPSEGRVDPMYGQRSAIPGLDDDTVMEANKEGLNYDEDGESGALAYLRAVRQEAISIPNILAAPAFVTAEEEYDDGRAFYEDGAYFASNLIAEDDEVEGGFDYEEPDPRLERYDSVLTRYEALREVLQQTPPETAVARLDADHPTSLGHLETKVVRWWRWKMRTTDPLPVQVASMTKATVLRLLGLATTGTLLSRGAEVEVGVSAWVWALLARLPNRGEMNSEEIGVVRDLGKKAVLVGMGLKEKVEWEEGMDEFEGAYDDENTGGGERANGSHADLAPSDHSNGRLIGPQLPGTESQDDEETNNTQVEMEDGEIAENPTPQEDFAATKARLLSSLDSPAVQETTPDSVLKPQDNEVRNTHLEQSLSPRSDDSKNRNSAEMKPKMGNSSCITIGEIPTNVQPTSEASRWNTKATVDMIITIAGEMYGQRDLLEFRSVWADA